MDQADPVELITTQLEAAPGFKRLRELLPEGQLDTDTAGALLAAAMRFSQERLASFDATADREGCSLEQGRVRTATGHREVWEEFKEQGWTGLGLPAEYGGQELPWALTVALQECFDRGSVTFGMVPGAARSAMRLLLTHGSPAQIQHWVPLLGTGSVTATICISEPGAGSDVNRIRSFATPSPAGDWQLTGEKVWISFGDHDLSECICHFVLAQTAAHGTHKSGLSLFLVRSSSASGEASSNRNGIRVQRIEQKLGLHGSPTCSLSFERSEAELIGEPGRGLPQLFAMIVSMRLQVGTQGLGLGEASLETAAQFARERRQGGDPRQPAVPIIEHVDIQLVLTGLASRLCSLRGLIYAAAIASDLVEQEQDEDRRREAHSLRAWLLPIVKSSGAQTGFETAAESLLVLGGAGYTRDFSVERSLRDARVLSIYEGTAGMQAIDLVERRWKREEGGIEAFIRILCADAKTMPESTSRLIRQGMDALAECTAWLRDAGRSKAEIDAGCRPALRLATEVAHGWIGARLTHLTPDGSAGRRLKALGRHALALFEERLPGVRIAFRSAASRQSNSETLWV